MSIENRAENRARKKTCFHFEDLSEQLPDPGYYAGSITSARFRRSAKGNRMLQVVYALQGVASAHQPVSDYFVLQGEQVSPVGISRARRRLLELYHACRIYPQEGDEITPATLLNARLQLRVEHEQWEGRPTLRVVAYRPLYLFDSEEQPPFSTSDVDHSGDDRG